MLLLMLLRKIQSLDRKPPVTLALMGTMGWLHFQKLIKPSKFKQYSLCPDQVAYSGEVSRVVASGFLHGDDIHLYHNMMSFLWKGYHLEHRFGPLRFALVITYLLLLSHILVVVVAIILDMTDLVPGQSRRCSIGFSGVLFALKVLLNHGSPAFTSVYGVRVPTKYAAWLELVVIQFAVPRASFLGHMCGILAGYIFVLTCSDERVIDVVAATLFKVVSDLLRPPTPQPAPTSEAHERHERAQQTHAQHPDTTPDVYRRFQAYEIDQQLAATAPSTLTQEDLRRRRLARLDNT